MNDFSKHELRILQTALSHFYGKTNENNSDLCKKIQDMIDNYCDHECNHEFESLQAQLPLAKTICCGEELEYTSTTWSTPKCHKCGRKLNDYQ